MEGVICNHEEVFNEYKDMFLLYIFCQKMLRGYFYKGAPNTINGKKRFFNQIAKKSLTILCLTFMFEYVDICYYDIFLYIYEVR